MAELSGKRARAKGFYNPQTAEITIVIPNHRSVQDVEQTLLHEAVAHYGLRKLFGEHFDTFLKDVYEAADEGVRRRITDLGLKKYRGNFHTATEEYLASLAEDTDFEHILDTFWGKIKRLFLEMLHEIGFDSFAKRIKDNGLSLSDNELRYILWRSYENLKEPGRYRSILGTAKDVAKQAELKVGNYAENSNSDKLSVAADLFRDGDSVEYRKVQAHNLYEQRVSRGLYQMQEAIQDSMLGLKEAMETILKAEGGYTGKIEDVAGYENPYLGENRLSSVNQAECSAFAQTLFKLMLEEVAKLAKTAKERAELTSAIPYGRMMASL
ncbi:MAG: hypothetical protein K6A82_09710 [Prevotella sp.]|nr:hypothetical protein [Prevotella sp.]